MAGYFRLFSFAALCVVLLGCKNEPPPDLVSLVSGAESITVYDLDAIGEPEYPESDLKQATQSPFDLGLFRELAPHAKFSNKSVWWMGDSLAIVKMKDGTQCRLALSYYGGFFKVLGKSGYFYFEGKEREKFDRAYGKIIHEDFIPKRGERNQSRETP